VLGSAWRSARMGAVIATVICAVGGVSGLAWASAPDSRVYEMASPMEKNGGDVKADSQRTRAATAGDAVQFLSGTGFVDVHGLTEAADYMSVRSSDPTPGNNGWVTHAITPPQAAMTLVAALNGLDPEYVGELSSDLSTGIFQAWSPLTNSPNVANVENLYLRRDLRNPGIGSYQLLSDCSLCAEPGNSPLAPIENGSQLPFLAGTSADFTKALFEYSEPLVPGATAGTNLYESDHGIVRLAGILPESACGAATPPCVASSAVAGSGVSAGRPPWHPAPRTISSDGRRIFFTDLSTGTGNNDGTLYMRLDNGTPQAQTIQLNASERTDCAGDPTCGGNGIPDPAPDSPQPAIFQDASVDGSRVFFTSREPLTDDAPVGNAGGGALLYMYDTTKPDSDPHNLTLISPGAIPQSTFTTGVPGTLAVSEHGDVVYFLSFGQLVPNEPDVGKGIYAWHDTGASTGLDYVGGLARAGDAEENDVGPQFVLSPSPVRITPDGHQVLFVESDGSELPALCSYGPCVNTIDPAGVNFELYLYNLDDSTVRCVSCNPNGTAPSTPALDTIVEQKGGAATTTHINHALSQDGTRVFFHTSDKLLPEDTNGVSDTYEWEANSAGSCHEQPNGCLSLISTGRDPNPSYFMDATPTGDDAFFTTSQQLVGWDNDTNVDLYDAREPHTGHPAGFPNPTPTATCTNEACRTTLLTPPLGALTPAGSATTHSHGNTTPPHHTHKHHRPHCHHGYRLRRIHHRLRCVRTHHRTHHHT
jgi:hypothetical protein